MEDILDDTADEYNLRPDLALRFMQAALQYCQVQSRLANWNGWPCFKVTMKHHYILHIASRAQWVHPRLGWCFMAEDYMCRIRELVHSIVAGTPPDLVPKINAKQMVRAMHYQMTGMGR